MSNYDGEPPGNREHGGFARQAAEHFPRADLKAYMDGELAAPRRFVVRRHLARCADCREEVRWLKRLGEDMRDLEHAVPRPELRARILANLPETPPAPMPVKNAPWERILPAMSGWNPTGRGLRPAFGVAVVAFILGGAIALPRLFSGTPTPVVTPPGDVPATPSAPITRNTTSVVPSQPETRNIAHNNPNNTFAPWDAPPSHFTDPTSQEAQRLYLKRKADDLAAEARRQRALKQEQANAGNTDRYTPTPTEARPPMQLALAVKEVNSARENLSALAKRLGGNLSTPDRQATEGSREAAVPTAPPPASDPSANRPIVLAMNIPAERMNDLTDALGHMGTLSRMDADRAGAHSLKGRFIDKRAQMLQQQGEEPMPASASGPKRVLKMNPSVRMLLQPPNTVLRSNARAISPDLPEQKQRPFVTVLIRLQQAGASPVGGPGR